MSGTDSTTVGSWIMFDNNNKERYIYTDSVTNTTSDAARITKTDVSRAKEGIAFYRNGSATRTGVMIVYGTVESTADSLTITPANGWQEIDSTAAVDTNKTAHISWTTRYPYIAITTRSVTDSTSADQHIKIRMTY